MPNITGHIQLSRCACGQIASRQQMDQGRCPACVRRGVPTAVEQARLAARPSTPRGQRRVA